MGSNKPAEGNLRNGCAAAQQKPSDAVSWWCVMHTAALNQSVVHRTTVARREEVREDSRPARTSLDNVAFEQGFVWYPRPPNDVEDDLPTAIRQVAQAWVEEAERERLHLRRRRGLYFLLVLTIGVSALALSQEPATIDAIEYIGFEVAHLATKALP